MVAIAFMFAPSESWMDAYWDCTRPSSEGSIPDSSYGLYWESGVVAFRYPVLMLGSRPGLMPLFHETVLLSPSQIGRHLVVVVIGDCEIAREIHFHSVSFANRHRGHDVEEFVE